MKTDGHVDVLFTVPDVGREPRSDGEEAQLSAGFFGDWQGDCLTDSQAADDGPARDVHPGAACAAGTKRLQF